MANTTDNSSLSQKDLESELQAQIDSLVAYIKSANISDDQKAQLSIQKSILQQELDALTNKVEITLEDEKNVTRIIAIAKSKQLAQNAIKDKTNITLYVGIAVVLVAGIWYFSTRKNA